MIFTYFYHTAWTWIYISAVHVLKAPRHPSIWSEAKYADARADERTFLEVTVSTENTITLTSWLQFQTTLNSTNLKAKSSEFKPVASFREQMASN